MPLPPRYTLFCDFLFLRLTFLFLVAGLRLPLSVLEAGPVSSVSAMTSISSLRFEVGSWITVHWGTVTGFSFTPLG